MSVDATNRHSPTFIHRGRVAGLGLMGALLLAACGAGPGTTNHLFIGIEKSSAPGIVARSCVVSDGGKFVTASGRFLSSLQPSHVVNPYKVSLIFLNGSAVIQWMLPTTTRIFGSNSAGKPWHITIDVGDSTLIQGCAVSLTIAT